MGSKMWVSVWVITPEDLILSKLGWAKQTRSELQLRDVQAMIAVQQDLDCAYIDRLRMVSDMAESAKRLIAASVRSTEPDISETELRVRIFDRLYVDDFDETTKAKLRAALRRMG